MGDPAVTNAVVPVGAYTLAEAGGPGGYTASALGLHRGDLDRPDRRHGHAGRR